MTSPLRIFVAYGSWHVAVRVINMIRDLPNIELVGQAYESDDAVVQVCLKKPDLAIVDVLLSEGHGLEVLRSARNAGINTRIIMTAATAYPQYRRECLKDGADFYFHLPDETEELRRTVVTMAMDAVLAHR